MYTYTVNWLRHSPSSIIDMIRLRREKEGKSQRQYATEVGISKTKLSHLENGDREATLEDLIRLIYRAQPQDADQLVLAIVELANQERTKAIERNKAEADRLQRRLDQLTKALRR